MRIIDPGTIRGWSNETTTVNHLLQVMLAEPEVIPQVATLFQGDSSPFTSLLAKKNLVAKGLKRGFTSDNYRVVGNRKVMWPIKSFFDRKKGRILSFEAVDTARPGYGGSVIKMRVDTNWFSPYDVLELKDLRTLVHVVDDQLPQEVEPGVYEYITKMVRSDKDEYINPELLTENSEVGFAYTMFYEMSETAYEKYTFDNWATSHMTIQRMKWSISGSAAATKTKKVWVAHNGQYAWMEQAELQMLKRWAEAREYQILFGKSTVGEGDTVLMKDMKGREIIGGDGLLNIGDGSLRFPVNKFTEKTLMNIMRNMKIFSDANGLNEVAVIGGLEFMNEWSSLMRSIGAQSFNNGVVEGSGSSKGINLNYAYYELNGVRFTPVWDKFFDNPARPQWFDERGVNKGSQRAIFVSLGQADVGSNNIELLALGDRGFKSGSVYGINKGGEGMQNSVDGEHHHVLCETGIRCDSMYGVAEVYRA